MKRESGQTACTSTCTRTSIYEAGIARTSNIPDRGALSAAHEEARQSQSSRSPLEKSPGPLRLLLAITTFTPYKSNKAPKVPKVVVTHTHERARCLRSEHRSRRFIIKKQLKAKYQHPSRAQSMYSR
ncbi:uncharacterized protein TRIVIDRAFT_187163 [Trichoderma virens Gv29-8]|uniref:Uncharacterized protein n=1 Tax=Hypocrea virens (strain Gv29-8 / FGSC 10586) TaxID=413071 RepID=G9N610_HYPVG|nr:uncharacterized protein TRIVIDRAFT_187163 [Trichoderma virens Gv29-8]EHK18201.1 hypothetical protein TRIVIDRAFT_187163 [Trichoderma virens Gv29-8]